MAVVSLYSIWHRIHIALRDTDKFLEDTAKDRVYLQKDRLDESNKTEIAIPDIYDNLTHDFKQIKEILIVLTNELQLRLKWTSTDKGYFSA